jgi:hypothetical protein
MVRRREECRVVKIGDKFDRVKKERAKRKGPRAKRKARHCSLTCRLESLIFVLCK